eukprot:5048-Heterococcus_DN1.PRE.5
MFGCIAMLERRTAMVVEHYLSSIQQFYKNLRDPQLQGTNEGDSANSSLSTAVAIGVHTCILSQTLSNAIRYDSEHA